MVEEPRNVYILDYFVGMHPDNLTDTTPDVKIPPALPDSKNWYWTRGPFKQRLPGWRQRSYDIWKYYESVVRPHVQYNDFDEMFSSNDVLAKMLKERYDEHREAIIQCYNDISRLINQELSATTSVAKRKARQRLNYVRTALYGLTNPLNQMRMFRVKWKPVRDDDFVYFSTIDGFTFDEA